MSSVWGRLEHIDAPNRYTQSFQGAESILQAYNKALNVHLINRLMSRFQAYDPAAFHCLMLLQDQPPFQELHLPPELMCW